MNEMSGFDTQALVATLTDLVTTWGMRVIGALAHPDKSLTAGSKRLVAALKGLREAARCFPSEYRPHADQVFLVFFFFFLGHIFWFGISRNVEGGWGGVVLSSSSSLDIR